MKLRTVIRRRSLRERVYDDGTPEWASVRDVARTLEVSRVHAWRIVRALHRALGSDFVERHERKWRVRTAALARWQASRGKSDADRITELQQRIAELEERLEEQEKRVDQQAEDLQELRDLAVPNRRLAPPVRPVRY